MTGRTVWHLPNYRDGSPEERQERSLEAAQTSLPALFRAAGYATFRTCKQGNTFGPANDMFEVNHAADKRGATPEEGSPWHGERALEFLRARAANQDERPFLMYLGFSHPHDPRNGTPELLKKYGAINTHEPPQTVNPAAPPLPVNYLPAHPFPHGHPHLRDEVKVSGVMESRSEATVRNEIGREYACIENIDIQVGRVLDMIRDMGEMENTYIFFTSDHGIAVGRHGLMGKQNLYEHTWRVPFLVCGPGIQPGSEASGYIYLLDMLPTLCDLAGIGIPDTAEGISFRPVLEGKQDRMRDAMYGMYCGGTKPGMRAVKKDGWKLIKYDVLDGTVHETQLFDLHENPFELLQEHKAPEVVALTGNVPRANQVDLAEDPRYATKLRELEGLLLEEEVRFDDPYRLWDQPGLTENRQ